MRTNCVATYKVEQGLRALYHTPEPQASFVGRLEQDILAGRVTTPKIGKHKVARKPGLWRRWALIPAALALALALIVVVVGPQQVWSALQSVIGYIPGYGFNLSGALRILAEPSAIRLSDNLHLQVDQAKADVHSTILLLHLDGVATPEEEEEIWNSLVDPNRVQVALVHPDGYPFRLQGNSRVPSPEDTENGATWYWGFPSVPYSQETYTLELIGVGEGTDLIAAGERITTSLTLLKAEPGVAGVETATSQWINQTSEPDQGCAITVYAATYSQDEIGVEARVTGCSGTFVPGEQPILTDDLGHDYPRPDRLLGGGGTMMTFNRPPSASQAQTLTLTTETVGVHNWTPDDTFYLDFGPTPAVGASLSLDIEVALPDTETWVRITSARLQDTPPPYGPDENALPYYLVLTSEVTYANPGLRPISLGFDDGRVTVGTYQITSTSEVRTVLMESSIPLRELPAEPIPIRLRTTIHELDGHWEVSWPIERVPGGGPRP